jgi:hypothetical protein
MKDSPYPGLNPYLEEDSNFFFGRAAETELVSANLLAARLTLLYGPSGVGKSSVLNAGVTAHLRGHAASGSDLDLPSMSVVVFRAWQGDPLKNLIGEIRAQVGGPDLGPQRLRDYLAESSTKANRELYIILDQFEEYFLYHNDGTFGAELAQSFTSKDNNVNFLISIREDAVAKLDVFKGRIANLFDNYLRISHLSESAARSAIQGPLDQYNALHRANSTPIAIGKELPEEILVQLTGGEIAWDVLGRGAQKGYAEANTIEAPYLQLVLRRLWREEMAVGSNILRSETLARLGGCLEIVKRHLDDVLREFSEQERNLAARLFHYLVTPSGAKIAHTMSDLAAYVESPLSSVEPVVRKLAQSGTRVLREVAPARPAGPAAYEIFHDALAPAVLDWRRRQIDAQSRQGQRLAVSVLKNAIEKGLSQFSENTDEIKNYILEQVSKSSSASQAGLTPGTLSGRRLLWVDDRPGNNIYEMDLFQRAGMDITTVISTHQANGKLRSARFDLVISDIHREEEGVSKSGAGYELLRWMRDHRFKMPFIFYTGDASRVDPKRAGKALGSADNPRSLIELVIQAVRQDDIQKGRWGGRSFRNYRRLQAAVTDLGSSLFGVQLKVREARDQRLPDGDFDPGPLVGTVDFHLHQTFSKVLTKSVRSGIARCVVEVYGAFTVGAVADRGETHLELDLALDESFPKQFREN